MTVRNTDVTLPRVVGLLPLRNGVLFPGTAISLPIGRRRSLALVKDLSAGDVIAVGVQRDRRVNDPGVADLLPMGTYARVRDVKRVRRNQYRLVLEGEDRFHLDNIVASDPTWRAEVRPAVESSRSMSEARALAESLLETIAELQPSMSDDVREALNAPTTRDNPGRVADVVTASLGLPTDQEAEVLMALDVSERLRLVLRLMAQAQEFAQIKEKITREVHDELNKNQREVLLRQQLKAIQKELGEGEGGDSLSELKERLVAAKLPGDAQKIVDRELRRLESGSGQAEQHVIRNYLELIADLPWEKRAEVHDDINRVADALDEDHYGLEDVKKRILEHLAVRKMAENHRGAILCLVGPPGVGKTSLGQSIADATGRPFVRVSLGGVRDEAEIRGHRRTYVGALPGRILNALRSADVKNPVMMLDEVDKLSQGWMGSPEAALLEVLDPEQNHTFTDHYLEIPFDLSEVLFVCTANTLETLSPPLRDRLEIIELQGYTVDEKIQIARRHLIDKQLSEHGLPNEALEITDEALTKIITDYTREAGVRQLTRELTKICRSLTLRIARDPKAKNQRLLVDVEGLKEPLGKTRFFNDVAERTSIPGVATGLAWTPVGGDILFIESSRMPGKGKLEITGQLGDVMKESARAALTYIRSRAEALEVDPDFLENQDVHIHVPAGGIPKDGPSAGVTMFTALTSLLTGRRARSDTAMTGEVTLRGRVLPVGGIKAKILAAHRAGLARVILPHRNERDLEEVPEAVRESLEFIFAEDMGQVLEAALEPVGSLPGIGPDPRSEGGLSRGVSGAPN